MAANDARVDTTFIGYFLIGFVLLMLGVLGLQDGGLFGDFSPENYYDLPIDYNVLASIIGVIGMIMILLTIFAYRIGNKATALLFAFFGLSFIAYAYNEYTESLMDLMTSNSNWFLYVALAIFFLIFAINALVAKTPKFVAVLLFLVALTLFFFALCGANGWYGPGDNYDLYKAFGIVYGIFAFLGFIVATYLGIAYANPKKVPLI